MILPGNLICTVGTSLFYPNLKGLDPENHYKRPTRENDLPAKADLNALERLDLPADSGRLQSLLADLKSAFNSDDYARVAKLLAALPPELRLCGAEINSIDAMVRKGFLGENRHNIIFLVSDTPEGQAIGRILGLYFQGENCPSRFHVCHVETVTGLQDEQPLVFKTEGLPNLVRLLGAHYRRWGGAETVAINATGGYKAQIALAVAFGQATGTAVYYKHEKFDQVIPFPRIPFALDLSLVRDNLKLWADLAEFGVSFDPETLDRRLPASEELRDLMFPLLESIEEGSFYCLSALGLVYWEAFRSLSPDIKLKPARVAGRRGCRFAPDHHYPIGFKEHVRRFYDAFPDYVSECHSIDYSGQGGIKTGLRIKDKRLIGEYVDRDGFGARFEIVTSAENQMEREWLIVRFNEWL